MALTTRPLFDPPIVRRAVRAAFAKTVNLRHMVRNPVMFVVMIGSALTTLVLIGDIANGRSSVGFTLQLTLWLWFTVVFANFAEAMAEGRGKALNASQVAILRLISRGHSNREIAAEVHLSENTVKTHVQEIFRKLGVRNRVEAAIEAGKSGWI